MLSNRNIVMIEGGLTRDPEVFESGVVHLSIGVDNAGNEKGVQNPSGYFDVKFWINDSKFSPQACVEAIKTAIGEKTLVKGARVSVIGRLTQERWTKDGAKSSRIVIVADTLNVFPKFNKQGTGDTKEAAAKTFDFSEF